MKPFVNRSSVFWFLGVAALILGFVAAAVVLPGLAEKPDPEAPEVRVPNMQNVPPPSRKVELEVPPSE